MSDKFQPGDKVIYHCSKRYASLSSEYEWRVGEIVRRCEYRVHVYIVHFNDGDEWYVTEDELDPLGRPIEWTSQMTGALQTLYGDI